MANHRILVIGDKDVGKSVLTSKFLKRYSEVKISVEKGFEQDKIDYHGCEIEIWIPHDEKYYYEIGENILEKIHGIILVFDISRPDTCYHLAYWFDTIRHGISDLIPVIVVGNKVDKRYWGIQRSDEVIGAREGSDFVKKLSNTYGRDIPYFELSSYRQNMSERILDRMLPSICKKAKIEQIKKQNRLSSSQIR